MKLKQAVELLEKHNKWRRGDENITQSAPRQLGIAIDMVVSEFKDKEAYKSDAIEFAMWLAMNYADVHMDINKKTENEEGYVEEHALSILNMKNSYWYKQKYIEFTNSFYKLNK